MYPDLSYLLNDIFGTPVDNWASAFKTFGLMLALAFVACAMYVKAELKRKEEEGLISATTKSIETKGGIQWKEVIYNSLVIGLVGLKLPFIINNFEAFQQDPAAVILSGKGNWLVAIIAFVITAIYSYYVQSKEDLKPGKKKIVVHPHERTGDIIIIAAIFGVIGAKVFSILENLDAFFADPLGQLLSGSGLTVYGGLIFGGLAVYYYVKKNNIKPIHMLDIGGPGILIGYAVGRIGCQLSGDGDWGIVAAAQPDWWILPDWMWSYNFPNNVANSGGLLESCDTETYNSLIADRSLSIEQKCKVACGVRYCHELKEGVYPTSFYETIISLTGVAIFWIYRRRIRIGGMLFAMYLVFNGIERFFIETIRVNEKYNYFGFNWSQAQYISILLILTGIIAMIYLYKNGKRYDVVTNTSEN